MLEQVEESSAVEALRLKAKMCANVVCSICPVAKMREKESLTLLTCREFQELYPEKVFECVKQWKKLNEKPIETKFAKIVRILEVDGYTRKCVHEEEVTSTKNETFRMAMKRVLEEYYENHEGNFIAVFEERYKRKE